MSSYLDYLNFKKEEKRRVEKEGYTYFNRYDEKEEEKEEKEYTYFNRNDDFVRKNIL
jgi:hypothetical protein